MLLDLLRLFVFALTRLCSLITPWDRRWALRYRLQDPHWGIAGGLWFHGASLGECKVLLHVAQTLPHESILLTTQKREVRDWLAQQCPCHVHYAMAPLDHPQVLAHFFSAGLPRAVVLCEGELWLGWLHACQSAQVPIYLISTRMNPSAFRLWKTLAPQEIRKALLGVSQAWVQDLASAQYLSLLGLPRVRPSGDWKWLHSQTPEIPSDAAWEARPCDLALLSLHRADWPSVQEGLQVLCEFGAASTLIPRKPADVAWFQQRLAALGVATTRWPELQRGTVCLVEGFGKVPEVLHQSRLALMGGSFCSVSTHNYREPLLAGVPVLVGPKGGLCEEELQALEQEGALRRIANLTALCIGRKGRDCWLPGWYPWEARQRIARSVQIRQENTQRAWIEFLRELESK